MTIESDIQDQFPVLKENFADRAVGRLISQFQESEKFIGEVRAYQKQLDKVKDAVLESLAYRSLEKSEGLQLDIIGVIVGQPRISIPDASIKYFGFEVRPPFPATGNLGFGNGRLITRTENQNYIKLTDSEYRFAIIGRIFANFSKSTPDDASDQFYAVFGIKIFVLNGAGAVRIYFFDGRPTESQRILITYRWTDGFGQERDFLPYTLGVDRQIRETGSKYYFGFGSPMTRGFGVGSFAGDSTILS